jgi:hypothetical protein
MNNKNKFTLLTLLAIFINGLLMVNGTLPTHPLSMTPSAIMALINVINQKFG